MTCKYIITIPNLAGANVVYEGTAENAKLAQADVHDLLGMDKPEAPTVKGEQKNDSKAASAKSSPAAQTQNAVDNSTPSSNESKQANDSGASGKPEGEGKPLDYTADIKPLILEISKKDKEKAVALLRRFGATNGQQLKAEQYPDFQRDAKRVIAGEYDPLASNDEDVA